MTDTTENDDFSGWIGREERSHGLVTSGVPSGTDLPPSAALTLERKSFQRLFDTSDQKEGMKAFIEARPAKCC